jgi:hypothetical protein
MEKQTLLKYFGGTGQTAVALHVKQPAVSQWPEVLPFSALGRIAYFQPKAWHDLVREERKLEAAAGTMPE